MGLYRFDNKLIGYNHCFPIKLYCSSYWGSMRMSVCLRSVVFIWYFNWYMLVSVNHLSLPNTLLRKRVKLSWDLSHFFSLKLVTAVMTQMVQFCVSSSLNFQILRSENLKGSENREFCSWFVSRSPRRWCRITSVSRASSVCSDVVAIFFRKVWRVSLG
jgi:hypothetical protein